MATLDQQSKERLSDLLERASSWVGGERSVLLMAASKEILGAEPEEARQEAIDSLTRVYNVPQPNANVEIETVDEDIEDLESDDFD